MKEYYVKLEELANHPDQNDMCAETLEVQYKSGKLLLGILQKEYDYDMQNLTSLYTRAGVTIAFVGVYLNLIAGQLKVIFGNFNGQLFSDHYSLLATVLAIFIAIFSLTCFLRILISEKSERLDINMGFDEKTMINSEDVSSRYLVDTYKEIMNKNIKIIERKNRLYRVGSIGVIISILIYVIGICIKYNVWGALKWW